MNNTKRKLFRVPLTVILVFAIFLITGSIISYAGENDSMSGWMWGGGAEPDGALPGDGSNTNFGWVSANSTNLGGGIDYGVQIPRSNGDMSGYAWSENVGWISFNAMDLAGCPSGACSARRNGDNLEGWARIVGIKDELAVGNSGGWQGWIKLFGFNYGVEITDVQEVIGVDTFFKLNGYAWSDELGWVDFSEAKYKLLNLLKVCKDSCNSGFSAVADETIPGSEFLMKKYEKSTLKACYNISDKCDLASGDVTAIATWDEADPGNPAGSAYETIEPNTVKIEGTRGSSFFPAFGVPKEGMTVTYNDGVSNKIVQFDVNVAGVAGACADDLASKSSCITPDSASEIDNLCREHYDAAGNPPTITEVGDTFTWTCGGDDAPDSAQCNMDKSCEYKEVGL